MNSHLGRLVVCKQCLVRNQPWHWLHKLSDRLNYQVKEQHARNPWTMDVKKPEHVSELVSVQYKTRDDQVMIWRLNWNIKPMRHRKKSLWCQQLINPMDQLHSMNTLKCGLVFCYLVSNKPFNSRGTECFALDIPMMMTMQTVISTIFLKIHELRFLRKLFCTHPFCPFLSQVLYVMNWCSCEMRLCKQFSVQSTLQISTLICHNT